MKDCISSSFLLSLSLSLCVCIGVSGESNEESRSQWSHGQIRRQPRILQKEVTTINKLLPLPLHNNTARSNLYCVCRMCNEPGGNGS